MAAPSLRCIRRRRRGRAAQHRADISCRGRGARPRGGAPYAALRTRGAAQRRPIRRASGGRRHGAPLRRGTSHGRDRRARARAARLPRAHTGNSRRSLARSAHRHVHVIQPKGLEDARYDPPLCRLFVAAPHALVNALARASRRAFHTPPWSTRRNPASRHPASLAPACQTRSAALPRPGPLRSAGALEFALGSAPPFAAPASARRPRRQAIAQARQAPCRPARGRGPDMPRGAGDPPPPR